MVLPFMVGIRRAMRRHQGLPPPPTRLPLWRLLLGELAWAFRQLLAAPWVLGALVLGSAASMAVLGAAAPGPVLDPPWRILVALGVGLLLAVGVRRVRYAAGTGGSAGEGERHPGTAAVVLSGSVAAVVLAVWLLVWLVTHLG